MIKTTQSIDSQDLDALVVETYGRPYNFQQQDGCQERGGRHIIVPTEPMVDYEALSVSEVINGSEMGVAFASWLARDPAKPVDGRVEEYAIELWWERNFYPHQSMILNDLHARGLLGAGEYVLVIDW